MKKYIVGALLSFAMLISPAFAPQAAAASLSTTQVSAIIGLLQAFGADQSVINNVQAALTGSSSTNTNTNNGTDTSTTGTGPSAQFTFNGMVSATNIDPLLSRTWAWSSTNGKTFKARADISGCEASSQNGTVADWQPWGSSSPAQGSTTMIPGAGKYGCTIVATYQVTDASGLVAIAKSSVTFKKAVGTYDDTVTTINPVITTTSLPNAVVGQPYDASVVSTGGTGVRNWGTSSMPANLQLNLLSSTGSTVSQPATVDIIGTPTTAGIYAVTFTVTVGTRTAQKTLPLTVLAAGSSTTGQNTGTNSQNLCPDGTVRDVFVVGPSTGCEGHTGTTNTGSQNLCPDGTVRAIVVVGPAGPNSGCEGHLGTSGTTVAPAISVANSASGPFTVNGTVYNNAPLYARTTGVSQSNPPRGCAQPVGSTGCFVDSGYRDFLASEWYNSTTIQTYVADPSVYPLTTYETYIKYAGGSPIKVGTFVLKAATAGSQNLCPDGTVRATFVVGPSTGCEGHMGTTNTAATLAVAVSNLASGPFTVNGKAFNNAPMYARITGVSQSNPPRGCTQPAGSTGCLVDSGYRDFAASEWYNSTTIQTYVPDPSIYPLTTYETYIKYAGGSPIKAGTFVLAAGPQTKSYQWSCVTPGPAYVNYASAAACTAGTVNQTATISGFSCTCVGIN